MKTFVREVALLARDIYQDVRPDKDSRRHMKYVQQMRKKHGVAWRVHTFDNDAYAKKILERKEVIQSVFPLQYFIGNAPLSRYLVCNYRRDHDGDLGEPGDVYTASDFSTLENEVANANVHTSSLPGFILDLDTGHFYYLDLSTLKFASFASLQEYKESEYAE